MATRILPAALLVPSLLACTDPVVGTTMPVDPTPTQATCVGDTSLGDPDGDGLCGLCEDRDLDGICNSVDLCEGDDTTGDADSDGICDDRDLCDGDGALDVDLDGICDDEDACAGDNATGDADGDGLCADVDPCEDRFNPNFEPICNVWFVSADASGTSDGTSWADAFAHPVAALAAAAPGDEIWVAAGTYTALTAGADPMLTLVEDVGLYGGFDGTELDFADRARLFDATVLTGDVNGDDDPSDPDGTMTDNAAQLVFSSVTGAVLDGFRITAGYAPDDTRAGTGLRMEEPMTLRDVMFTETYPNGSNGILFISPGDEARNRDRVTTIEDVTVLGGNGYPMVLWSGRTISVTGFTGIDTEGPIANYGSGRATLAHVSMWPKAGFRSVENNGGVLDLYNSALWSDGTVPIFSFGVTAIHNVCANQDITTVGGDVTAWDNVTLTGAGSLGFPFDPTDDTLFLDANSACVDAGSVHWATLSDEDRRSTQRNGTPDQGAVDAGASYVR